MKKRARRIRRWRRNINPRNKNR